MSDIYITEPPTKGKVILRTTLGDLDVELWSKETPKACRNFVQLCLEGYYDNTIFHRIVKGFIMQGGDPTGTGYGGESIYGSEAFPDEFHSRIRFSHRGLVALAGGAAVELQNASQFFITLEKTPELQGKHTIFGKITGDTIFNVLKANDFEVDENERPTFPPKLLSVDVVWNPFDDIVPRENKRRKTEQDDQKPRKPTKAFNLLSFGDEAEEEEQQVISTDIKMKSSYHYSDDPAERQTAEEVEKRKEQDLKRIQERQQDDSKKATQDTLKKVATGQLKQDTDTDFDKRMKDKIRSTKRKYEEEEEQAVEEKQVSEQENRLQAIKDEQRKLKKEILSSKKKDSNDKSQKETKLSLVEEQRAKYLAKRKGGSKPDQHEILSKLDSFKQSLRTTASSKYSHHEADDKHSRGDGDGDDDDDDLSEGNDSSWKLNALKFVNVRTVKDPMARREEEYTIFDPLKFQNVPSISQHQRKLSAQKKLHKW